jgi:hypothetical protein
MPAGSRDETARHTAGAWRAGNFVGRYSHRWLLLVAFGGYALAKVTEAYDEVIFTATGGMFSGHSIKHVLAAAACYSILVMLAKRRGR